MLHFFLAVPPEPEIFTGFVMQDVHVQPSKYGGRAASNSSTRTAHESLTEILSSERTMSRVAVDAPEQNGRPADPTLVSRGPKNQLCAPDNLCILDFLRD